MTFEGRVTTVIPKLIPNLADKNYYLCGHPMMVAAMNDVLVEEKVPAEKIVMEKFGR
jgi:NAD(P)H-flavin reductase